MTNYRIRYSKTTDGPKNTLATIQDGDYVYFGIARCNTKVGDRFNKKHGTMVSLARAEKMLSNNSSVWLNGQTYWFADNNLSGVTHVSLVKQLLQDFEMIDDLCKIKG
jgi:hypothetical protein